ncbi:MAG: hypothetical protein LBU55_02175 [Elusimicrobiota bacterium]|nr:hypothetical protein [Elusimicrobiota bacterium]
MPSATPFKKGGIKTNPDHTKKVELNHQAKHCYLFHHQNAGIKPKPVTHSTTKTLELIRLPLVLAATRHMLLNVEISVVIFKKVFAVISHFSGVAGYCH